MANNHPLAVYCSSCGAPANYDIVKQQYLCQYCGGVTGVKEPLVQLQHWRDARRKNVLRDEKAAEEVHSCLNCAAQVIIPKGEAMGKCDFCGGKFSRRAFVKSDELPELIIPFVLTVDEARERLLKWAHDNSSKKEAQAVLAGAEQLQGYYLPYELIRGPVTASVERLETFSDRKYHMGGFLNGIAVSTSKQLDNLVLDAMEPFEWTAARPFEFSFVAGHKVKLSDVEAYVLEQRVLDEVADSFRPEAEKVLQTTGISLSMQAGNLLRLPALLPVYTLSIGPVLAVVNGQTGRVAVSKIKLTHNVSWLLEPTLLTLLVGGVFAIWDVAVALSMALVFGIIFFAAFSDGRGDEWRRKIFKTDSARLERFQAKLTVDQGKEPIVDTTVKSMFMEPINGQLEPVTVSFYTPRRILMTLLGVLIFNGLPAIVAFMLDWEGIAEYKYNAVWMTLTVPITIILWVAVGRIRVYNFPIFKRMMPDGSTQPVKVDGEPTLSLGELFHTLKEIKDAGGGGIMFAIIGFILFMFLGTLGAILMPD
ncbi:Primosomal protein N' (replication factor Y) - superfamily II helicase [Anaerovibrio sp. JC8]|uniref:hypothetical protein n=1 Tax=Anaerovibrio sp. JC8 TaxID=1240085 RepID=UPI000A0D7892|nr:hypothetical protein [Anaerovibrio sp. JC8]ORT98883.1 Primosomal protein N' (replication factor Y) - superfamily II helicase [Anaerovibrio sp. JC8]